MTFREFLAVVELRTKIVSAGGFLAAALYARRRTGSIDPVRSLLFLAAALAVDMGTTGFNTYFDWYRNVDDPRFNREADKVLVHSGAAPGAALAASLLCFASAAVLGLALSFLAGAWLAAAGAVCMAVGFLYSGGPRPISGTPFGELFAGGFLGSIYFLLGAAVLGVRIDASAFLASAPQGFAVAAILAVNNACDVEGDRAAGRRTLAVLLGPGRAPAVAYAYGFLAPASLAACGALGVLPPAAVPAAAASALASALLWRAMARRGFSHSSKPANMGAVSSVFLMHVAATAAALSLPQ